MSHVLNDRLARTLMLLSFCTVPIVHSGQAQDVVCSGGFGSFESTFVTGVTVSVGAVRKAEFAGRACEAKLDWDKQHLLVEAKAWQVDVDAMGIDLALGSPVVAFQTRRTNLDDVSTYEIYSLKTPPRRLRTIAGGDSYSAADTDLDGRIEIWTSDAEAVNGFENIPLNALDFAPTVVLRFEQKRLIDVSSEFKSDFDRQIATVRAQLNNQQLSEFKGSDGALWTKSSMPLDQAHRLASTKIKVLEIIWCYLYSDREQQAWKALAEMWPEADFDRVRTAILNARARGVRRQVDGVSHESPGKFKKRHAMIYDRVSEADPVQGNPLSWDYSPGMSGPGKDTHIRGRHLPYTDSPQTPASAGRIASRFGHGGSGEFGDRRRRKGPVGEGRGQARKSLDRRHRRLEVYSRIQRRPPRSQPPSNWGHALPVEAVLPAQWSPTLKLFRKGLSEAIVQS